MYIVDDASLISRYKEEKLLTPLKKQINKLSRFNQLSLCLMSLERLYLSYFIKYYIKDAHEYFSELLNILENVIILNAVASKVEEEHFTRWSEKFMQRGVNDKATSWARYSAAVLFPDCLYPLTCNLVGVSRTQTVLDNEDAYKVGVDLCELFESNYLNPTTECKTAEDYVASLHSDVADERDKVLNLGKLHKEGKILQDEFFQAARNLKRICEERYPIDKAMFFELRGKKLKSKPEDMVLMEKESQRIEDDIKFLE